MNVIHKYSLYKLQSEVKMPLGSTILCVQLQDYIPTLWAMHSVYDSDGDRTSLEIRHFCVITTGQSFNSLDKHYITTLQRLDGLVLHVYEDRFYHNKT